VVRSSKKLKRYAFTLVELIFAIMVIAISVISLPMMTQITSKGIESNILQEAIFAASTELMGASAGYWDKNSMDDHDVSHIARVIDLAITPASTCDNNSNSSRYRLKTGHIAQKYHRRCLDSTIGAADVNDSTYINLDNAKHNLEDIFIYVDINSTGYKDSYKSSVAISRNGDIKDINISITTSGGKLIAKLKMKSANIGEIDYYKRRF